MEGMTSSSPQISDLTGHYCPRTIRTRYINARSHGNRPALGCQELAVGLPVLPGRGRAPPLPLTPRLMETRTNKCTVHGHSDKRCLPGKNRAALATAPRGARCPTFQGPLTRATSEGAQPNRWQPEWKAGEEEKQRGHRQKGGLRLCRRARNTENRRARETVRNGDRRSCWEPMSLSTGHTWLRKEPMAWQVWVLAPNLSPSINTDPEAAMSHSTAGWETPHSA